MSPNSLHDKEDRGDNIDREMVEMGHRLQSGDGGSSPRKPMYDQFPDAVSITRECRGKLAGVATMRPASRVPYSTLGMALDYRLRHYFPLTPIRELVAWHGAQLLGAGDVMERVRSDTGELRDPLPWGPAKQFLDSAQDVLEQIQPAGRRLERSQEELLARYCVVLALFEEVYRAGLQPTSPLVLRQPKTVADLLAIAEKTWIDDLCCLSWAFHERFGELLSHSVILNPTFDGSQDVDGADADLILDDCLIDIKATVTPRVEPIWLYQLLGYVLLDYSDRYRIGAVAIYLARQQTVLRWPLSDLMRAMAGGNVPPLGKLRARFQRVAGGTRKKRLAAGASEEA